MENKDKYIEMQTKTIKALNKIIRQRDKEIKQLNFKIGSLRREYGIRDFSGRVNIKKGD